MISAAKPSSPATPGRRWGDLLALGVVLIVGVGGSALGYRALRATEHLRWDEQRVAVSQAVMDSFNLELIRTTEAVRSATLMMESHPQLSRKRFNDYAAKVMAGLPSIAYLQWQPVVPHEQLAQFEAHARAQGLAHYRVVAPDGQGMGRDIAQSPAEHVPVLYAWPEDTAALGLDMSHDPFKMESKLQARDTGVPVASHAFPIVMANAGTSTAMAFTITGAVVNNDMHGVSSVGYLAAVVPLPALFKHAAVRANTEKFDFLVYDRSSSRSGPIYGAYGSDSEMTRSSAELQDNPEYDQIMTVDVANRLWDVVLHPRPAFFSNQPLSAAPWILASGLLATVSLLLTLASIQQGRRRVEAAQAIVTEQRQRLQELNNTLEQRVEERGAQLEAAMQTLRHSQEELSRSEARATLSTLVAGVSHELGAPMGNGMLAASSMADQARAFQETLDAGTLRRMDLATFVAQVREGSSLTLRNLERAVELLNKFRQVAADQASEQRRPFDLRKTIQEILDSLAPSLKNKPHRVVLDMASGISMDSYPGPLGQVLINLINNAYLHAFEGVAAGQVTVQAQTMQDTKDSKNDWLVLTVRDNGRGIAPDHLAQLCTPFFSTKIGQGGTGLGLSIVNNLVTKTLGGHLSVESEQGHGTLFTINIPRVAPDTTPAERI